MGILMLLLAWLCDLVALLTGLALLKDTLVDRTVARAMWQTLRATWIQLRTTHALPSLDQSRPAMRFGIRAALLVLIVASAGLCVLSPATGPWYATLLRMALALYMATQVPCPWVRWIWVGDARAKSNDPPGVERRDSAPHAH